MRGGGSTDRDNATGAGNRCRRRVSCRDRLVAGCLSVMLKVPTPLVSVASAGKDAAGIAAREMYRSRIARRRVVERIECRHREIEGRARGRAGRHRRHNAWRRQH